MRLKSDVAIIFPLFVRVVEKQFNYTLRTLYTDGGGEHVVNSLGISHMITHPYTPEHNDTAERRHRHIVETARTLLHHASILLTYWPYVFHTAVYLINRLPTSTLNRSSPFSAIFGYSPSYNSLR